MKQLTDEQYRQIGRDATNGMLPDLPNGITWVDHGRGDERTALIAAGRAAYEAAYPLAVQDALAEPTDEEINSAKQYDPIVGVSARKLFINRLVRLTAKPDPAVEAVASICKEYDAHTRYAGYEEFIGKVVAAVRAADKADKP